MDDLPFKAHDEQDQLIARILSGDIDLYAHIIRRYHLPVWRIANAMLFDKSRTEEMVHQAFVEGFEHLEQFKPGRDFGPWIKEITRNVVRKELRRESDQARRMDSYRKHLLLEMEGTDWSEKEERFIDALKLCLGQLSEQCQKAFQLRYTAGCTFEDIAKRNGSSADAARMMLARGRLLLRGCIEKRMESP